MIYVSSTTGTKNKYKDMLHNVLVTRVFSLGVVIMY